MLMSIWTLNAINKVKVLQVLFIKEININFIYIYNYCFFLQEPESPSTSNVTIKTELHDPNINALDPGCLGLDDYTLPSALILDSDDLGPMGGRFQLQTEDQNEDGIVFVFFISLVSLDIFR